MRSHRSTRRAFGFGIVLSALLLLLVVSVHAATVTVRVEDMTGANGKTIQVPVLVDSAPGIGAMHIELTYDEDVLEATGVERGDLLEDGTLLDFNIPEPGRVVAGIVTLDGIEGDGEVAVIEFKVLGEGDDTSPLELENTQAWESGTNRFDILVTAESGTFTVGSSSSIPWLWIAIALGVLLFLLVLFLLSRRKKQPAAMAYAPYTSQPTVTPISTPPYQQQYQPQQQPWYQPPAQAQTHAQAPYQAPTPAPAPTPVPPASQPPASVAGFCSQCGNPLAAGTIFCPKCGLRVAGT